ncbi:uncharacterized protein PG998_012555 [Apiospora kogelbergensis]|uniref:Uncharacterized protein n=1 Tax=Apiospora kogelbergensis TaxID=1337665 RepID=A0AAW0QN09_9PEZI
MLLTSSQVSIAISSGIVLLFTTALFLSGYAIQQRTLNDLRKAIRPEPRPSPKIHFQQPDRFKRSTTELPDGTVVEVDEDGNIIGEETEAKADPDAIRAPRMPQKLQSTRWQEIEVRPTRPDEVAQRRLQEQQLLKEIEEAKRRTEESRKAMDTELDGSEKPLSRAERRRRIKQDIRDLSQGEGPVYYQRRLW